MSREKSKGPSQRQLQVGELVRHALAEIFSRGELMDEMIERHPVTVPEVRMTPDLKLATCFVMPLGGEEAAEVVKQLGKHARYLRGEVARRVKLRYAPELRFRLDTSFDVSQRIDALLASPQVARDVGGDGD